jgi:hypothetical protein
MQLKWIPALFFLAGISSLIYEIARVYQALLLQAAYLRILQGASMKANPQAVLWTC